MTLEDRDLEVGSIVHHFKGNFYKIIGVAKHTESGESLVVYQALYPPFKMYARPEAMFCSEVDHEKYPDVEQFYRMAKVTLDSKENLCWTVNSEKIAWLEKTGGLSK